MLRTLPVRAHLSSTTSDAAFPCEGNAVHTEGEKGEGLLSVVPSLHIPKPRLTNYLKTVRPKKIK